MESESKAGQGCAEVDTYLACGNAPTEVSPADVREKFWDNVDRMLRSLPRRTRIIMAIDANAMMARDQGNLHLDWKGRINR